MRSGQLALALLFVAEVEEHISPNCRKAGVGNLDKYD